MSVPGVAPALPFTVAADRAGAVRRRRVAFPLMLLAALVGGVALGVGWAAVITGPAGLALACGLVLVVAVVAASAAYPRTRRPPEGDWLFRLEPDGLRLPPGRRAQPGQPGALVPWVLVTALRPRRRRGEDLVVVGVRPEAEAVLLEQGVPAAGARLAVRRGLSLRVGDGAESPARCLQLLAATLAERGAAA